MKIMLSHGMYEMQECSGSSRDQTQILSDDKV